MTPFVGSDPIPDAYQFLRNRHKGWNNAWDSKILAFRRHGVATEGEETTDRSGGARCRYRNVFLMQSTHPTQTAVMLEEHLGYLWAEEKAEYSRV